MIKGLQLLRIKDQHNISDVTFNEILKAIELSKISLYMLQKFLSKQTAIELNFIDCCVNSCIAYTGEFTNLEKCLICNELRYRDGEKIKGSRNKAAFWSIIDSLKM